MTLLDLFPPYLEHTVHIIYANIDAREGFLLTPFFAKSSRYIGLFFFIKIRRLINSFDKIWVISSF